MNILGLQKLTLLDYPGRLAAILFLGGCNFRCPFCQNSSLVLAPHTLPVISPEEFSGFLKKRAGMLDGICVTGGEPTLHADLPELFRQIHEAGYLAKLDTNGTNPEMLRFLIQEGLVDYVAMDIKAGRENYANVCGLSEHMKVPENIQSDHIAESGITLLDRVKKSTDILLHSNIEYEFRTTVVNGLHTDADFEDIAEWISGCSNYYLQSFRDCPDVLTEDHKFSAFSQSEMHHFLSIVQKKIPQASLRG